MRPELLLTIVFVPMIIEARRAARNERAQLARGGIEAAGDVYAYMAIAYPLAFLVMIGEALARHADPPAAVFTSGVLLFAAAKALKWWAIVSLGSAWTFRVIVVPGSARVSRGPYRFLAHPNYVGVAGELAGVALMAGARIAGPVATMLFCALIAKRIAVERSTLDAILPRNS